MSMTFTGLTAADAADRLQRFGPNEPVKVRHWSWVRQLLSQFANPLVAILLVASAISASFGQITDAVIIAVIVLLGIAIGFWQTYRSQAAARRLRGIVAPMASVCRDGVWQDVPMREIVPGDLVRLSAGDLVPADARLVEARDLSVQQAMLTGESLPADKAAATDASPDVGAVGETPSGPDSPHLVFLGTSVVSGTGMAAVVATGPRTLFGDVAARLAARAPETEFEHGLRRFSFLILATTVALVLFILLVSIAFRHNPFESLLFAVALGVGLTPEFLPMIMSVTLTEGAIRMAREQVIVKRLPAIQNFGGIDIFCSDKTGTLTTGVMRVDGSIDGMGNTSDRAAELGAFAAHFETGIRSPFDTALLEHRPVDPAGYVKIDEIPFDFERRRASVVVDTPHDGRLLIVKGAPEGVVDASTAYRLAPAKDAPLDNRARAECLRVVERLGADGFRVLGIASRTVPSNRTYGRDDEMSLVLEGFISFADPPKLDAADAIADLARDGVAVKILTGDSMAVAGHVCGALGLDTGPVITGDDLARLDDAALGHVAEQGVLFARVSPAQKNRVIAALKRRGHVVGYLGDGINDAPALHTADVGISVMSAVDVARDAADVILGEPSLRVLHRGIMEGRRASANMMKYLLMGTSSNFGNMFSMAGASLFLPFLPMLPTQILLNNFLYDLAQVAIPTDNVDDAYLRRPQRWDMRVIRDFMIVLGPVSSMFDVLTFYVLLRVFHADRSLFRTGWFVESLATQTLVLFVIRTMGDPLRSRPSRALAGTTLAIAFVGFVLPATPLAHLLGFTRPPLAYLAFVAGATAAYLALVEWVKRRLVGRLGLDPS